MASSNGIKFILGAQVVGVVSLIISLYFLICGTGFAVLHFGFIKGSTQLQCQSLEQDSIRKVYCASADIPAYIAIGFGVFGLLLFICCVLLLVAVSKDRPNLTVPYIIFLILVIIAVNVFAILSCLHFKDTITFLVVIIATAIAITLIPNYFLIVVWKHQSLLRKSRSETPIENMKPQPPVAQQPQPFVIMPYPNNMGQPHNPNQVQTQMFTPSKHPNSLNEDATRDLVKNTKLEEDDMIY